MDRIAEAVRSMVAWAITAFAPCIISQTSKEPQGPRNVPCTIDHIDTPMVRSAVLLVGRDMLGNGHVG